MDATTNNDQADAGHVESLADLAAEFRKDAAIADTTAAKAVTAEIASQASVLEADIYDTLLMLRDMAAPAVEEMNLLPPGRVAEIWTDVRIRKIAQPLAQIMQRHNLNLDQALDRFGPYAALIVGLWAPVIQTAREIRDHKNAPIAPPAPTDGQQQ